MIRSGTSISSLNLHKTQIGDDGAEAILEALIETADVTLRELDLGG